MRFAPDSPLEESGFEPSVPLGEKRSCQAWTLHAEPARADSDGHCLAARPRWHGSRMIQSNTDSRSARPPNGYSLECPFLEHVDYCLINEILLFPIVRSSDYFLGAGQIHERCSPTFNEREQMQINSPRLRRCGYAQGIWSPSFPVMVMVRARSENTGAGKGPSPRRRAARAS